VQIAFWRSKTWAFRFSRFARCSTRESRLFNEIDDYLARIDVDGRSLTGVAIWHDDEHKTTDIDGEAVVYLKGPIPADDRVKVYELPRPMAIQSSAPIAKSTWNALSQYARMMSLM
jgi:hypothetical protein